MSEDDIVKPTTVTFNVEEQKAVKDLGTFQAFSDFAHTALAEKIDRTRRDQNGAR